MVGIVKLLRSLTSGNRPAGRAYGEPYVNIADRVIGIVGSSGQPVDLVGPGFGNGGFINKIRNGTFDIWQRGASGLAWNNFTADGWIVNGSGTGVTIAQIAPRLLTRTALGITGVTGNTGAQAMTRIESWIAASLSNQQVTFQAQVYNGGASVFTPQLTVSHFSTPDNNGTGVIDLPYTNLQPCPPGVWTLVAYTWNALATASGGLQIAINFGPVVAGATVRMTECDLRATPGVPTGLNANPPPPELRPIGVEQDYCNRYYQAGIVDINGYGAASSACSCITYFPTTMRAAPTVAYSGITSSNVGGLTTASANVGGFKTFATAVATAAFYFTAYFTASAEI